MLKKMIIALFIIYWVLIFIVILFFPLSKIYDLRGTPLNHVMPFGYNMYVPLSNGKTYVTYDIYNKGKLVKKINSFSYYKNKIWQSTPFDKIFYNENFIYFIPNIRFENQFQSLHYEKNINHKKINIDSVLESEGISNRTIQTNKKFINLLKQKKEIGHFDSIKMYLCRKPIYIPFDKDYNNYSFFIKDSVMYQTTIKK